MPSTDPSQQAAGRVGDEELVEPAVDREGCAWVRCAEEGVDGICRAVAVEGRRVGGVVGAHRRPRTDRGGPGVREPRVLDEDERADGDAGREEAELREDVGVGVVRVEGDEDGAASLGMMMFFIIGRRRREGRVDGGVNLGIADRAAEEGDPAAEGLEEAAAGPRRRCPRRRM